MCKSHPVFSGVSHAPHCALSMSSSSLSLVVCHLPLIPSPNVSRCIIYFALNVNCILYTMSPRFYCLLAQGLMLKGHGGVGGDQEFFCALCGRFFLWPVFARERATNAWEIPLTNIFPGLVCASELADSRKLDKQTILPKKALRLLT